MKRRLLKTIAFLKRDLLIASSYKLPFVIQLLGMFVTMLMFFYISRVVGSGKNGMLLRYGGDYFSFVLIGVAITDYLLASVSSFSEEIRRAQLIGTLEALLVSPMSVTAILFNSSIFNYLLTSIRLIGYFCIGVFFFNMHLMRLDFFALFMVLLLTMLSFWGIGMMSAALVLVFKQPSPVRWILGPASGLLGGIFYPVEVLPDWLKQLSPLIPITHTVEALRRIMLTGAGLSKVASQIGILSIFALVLFPLGIWTFHRALTIARRNGSLLHY